MSERFVIAIDGGGTGTRAGLYDQSGQLIGECSGNPCNPFQTNTHVAATHVAYLAQTLLRGRKGKVMLIIAGISGARTERIREIFALALCQSINTERVIVTTDVHAQLLGNAGNHSAIAVVSGTGSSVVAMDANNVLTSFGGRGARVGDDGSAYHLAVIALRTAFRWLDEHGERPDFLSAVERKIPVKSDEELIAWTLRSKKDEIAAIAEHIIEFAASGDVIALASVANSVSSLAAITHAAIRRVELGRKAPIYVFGGMFEKSPAYRKFFEDALRKLGVPNELAVAPKTGHLAVYALAQQLPLPDSVPHVDVKGESIAAMENSAFIATAFDMPELNAESMNVDPYWEPESAQLRPNAMAPDEDNEPTGEDVALDILSSVDIVERMHAEDLKAVSAATYCHSELAMLINRIVVAFRKGGRLIYVGAGTSGRLGVLDASECPPTFGVPPGQVIGIIAGGDRAFRESIEGAEDDVDAARADIEALAPAIGPKDVVVGIAASGTTPYTLAAIEAGKSRGAATALVCCDLNATANVDHLVSLPVGPEPLPGSTRLKAGTATKVVLNAITTGAMALSGRVFEGYMIHVQPTNEKLKKRAVRIVAELTGLNDTAASKLLEMAGNDAAVTVVAHRANVSVEAARERLARTRGDVRAAIALGDEG
ncbi:MAG: N-acetylmuramic acid 6-phosphate etherase [Candidatus Hydrogenedentes bacterium]|nr:N-acetylmuramic acid 6-phosphate etherase [Candidatus Hydrogenedentota bacterium]